MAVAATHQEFQSEFRQIMKELTSLADEFAQTAKEIDTDATDVHHIALMIGAKNVDTATVTDTTNVAKTLEGVQTSAQAASASAHDATKATKAALKQLRTTHDGTQEAFNRSPVDKRQLAQVDPSWVTPL